MFHPIASKCPYQVVKLNRFQKKRKGLKENDFKVKPGSILEDDIREYYFTNRFS